jgi:thymidylate synthase
MLRSNPADRRVVVSMWDGHQDLGSTSKDIPCNTQVMFRVNNGALDMTTTNRSNDLIWGLMGANFVHMSIMHEWMAAHSGAPLGGPKGKPRGQWYHMSNNLHVYERHFKLIGGVKPDAMAHCAPYEHYQTVTDSVLFRKECIDLVEGKEDFFDDPFFDGTVAPMLASWLEWKAGNKDQALYEARCIDAWDWREATVAWYSRRVK